MCQVLKNVLFVFMFVSHGFEKLLHHFQEKFQFVDSKMLCNHQVQTRNALFIYIFLKGVTFYNLN